MVKNLSKKEKIIKSAIKCFNETGIEQTKIVDIAKYAEVNHSLVLYYFPNIKDLGKAVIESLIDELNQSTIKALEKSEQNSKALLKSYIDSTFLLVKKNKNKFTIWLHFYYKASHNQEYQDLNQKVRHQGKERIRSILLSLSEKKLIPSLSPELLEESTDLILGLMTGNLIIAMTESEKPTSYYSDQTYKIVEKYLLSLK